MNRKDILADIKAHPERHQHSFDELMSCCMTDGAVDMGIMEAHEGILARPDIVETVGSLDTGRPEIAKRIARDRSRCDVTSGACSCGATH